MTKARSLSDFIESDGSVTLVDNQKIKVGTGNDLEIYHDGNSKIETSSSSPGSLYIASQGSSNDLYLRSDHDIFIQPQGGENGITVTGDGAVLLYNDNAYKLATDADGVNIQGLLDVSSKVVVAGGTEATSTDGSIRTEGGLSVAKKIYAGGVLTANAGVVVDNITIDGTTASISGSADFTIDSGGRIDLSADDNGEVRLFDGSSMYAQFKDDEDRLRIQTLIQDKDMLFVGNDGGSEVTALSLDMSAAGSAIFNSNVSLGGTLELSTAGKYIQVTGSGGTAWAIGSSGGSNPPGTASTTLAFHHWDGSAWNNEVEFDSSGNIVADGNITAFSDERLKDNIQTLEQGLDKIEQLRGVTYTKDGEKNIGVIAQEVEKILPEIVVTGDTEQKLKSVDYSRITAVLIEAVKDLSARVKELEDK